MDPDSGLDAVRNLGIRGGVVEAISAAPLEAQEVIDARGLVVAPGFINLHWHGKDPHSDYYEAMDGVTSTFELEIGVVDVDRWYDERAGRMPINYGAAIGHAPSRMAVMNDPGDFLPAGDAARKPATDAEMREIAQRVEQGLKRGAVGVGFGLAYTPAASRWEILQMFRLAAQYKATTFVHIRGASSAGSSDREEGLLEAIALSAVSLAQMPKSLYPWWSNKIIVRQLGLSNVQVREIRDVVSHYHPQLLEDRAKVLRAEQNLEDQFNHDPVDQTKANQAVEQLISARSGLTRSLSELSLKLRVLLTAPQWQQLQRLRPASRN
jgi:Spy/CpxP family protein refolding chaperone